MPDVFDFMSASQGDLQLRREFIVQLYSDDVDNQQLSQWFSGKGYTVSPDTCRKLLDMNDNHPPGTPVPHY